MIHVRNLGKKSLKEVKEKIYSLGLSFKASNEQEEQLCGIVDQEEQLITEKHY